MNSPEIPAAIETEYTVFLENELIPIREGVFSCSKSSGEEFKIYGVISISWKNSPHLTISGVLNQDEKSELDQLFGQTTLSLPTGEKFKAIFLKLAYEEESVVLSGEIIEPLKLGIHQGIQSLVFHIANLQPMRSGRSTRYKSGAVEFAALFFEDNQYVFTFNGNERATHRFKMACDTHGHVLSHVLEVRKKDSLEFSEDECHWLRERLNLFLNFANGRESQIPIIEGFGKDQNKVVDHFPLVSLATCAKNRKRFLNENNVFVDVLKCFIAGVADTGMQELKLGVHWYIQTLKFDAYDSLVIGQVALELFSNAILLESHSMMSTEGFENLRAADKIALLMHHFKIDKTLTPEYEKIKVKDVRDLPAAITFIRNRIVHPTSKNRNQLKEIESKAVVKSVMITQMIMEHCILELVGFPGRILKDVTLNTISLID
ncbi:MAG: hypothetical protein EOO46_15010 [Flavobacterium sp.]|nr:MAG: hypothetical protein EOO46_15010 [Flavobacterium sp.]